jgi:hypothetical protein
MSLSMFQKICLGLAFVLLTGCTVDKCNDYVVAYDCTAKYGTDCRQHYLEMCEECERDNQ